jgi:hypothetical protein
MLDDVVAGRAAEAGNEPGTAGVVVRVAPMGVTTLRRHGPGIAMIVLASTVTKVHTSLSNGRGTVVQRRILIL